MRTHIGIDIIEIARIEDAIQEHGRKFLEKIFTEEEIAYCEQHKDAARHFAGRFAAKEAISKCFKVGISSNVRFHDIEVLPNDLLAPCAVINGKFSDWRVEVSISHDRNYAVAVAIAKKRRTTLFKKLLNLIKGRP